MRIRLLLGLALLAVSTAAIMARLLPGVPAVVIAFWRMASASAILWAYSTLVPQGPIPRGNRLRITLAGIGLGLHFACFFGALKLTTVANATLFATLAPLFTVLIERFGLQRPWNLPIITGLALALAGAVIVQGGNLDLSAGHNRGILLAVSSSLFLALVFLIAERIRQTTATLTYSRTLYTVAAITLLVISVAGYQNSHRLGAGEAFWLVMLGLVPTVIGHTTFNYCLKFIRPTVVAAVPLGEPVLASLLAWALFGEAIPLPVLVGGGLILGGLYRIVTHRQAFSLR